MANQYTLYIAGKNLKLMTPLQTFALFNETNFFTHATI